MHSKETISKIKRPPSEWEKIIAKETIVKELISKISKQLIQLNTRKQTTASKSGEKTYRHFSKEDIQADNKHKMSIFIPIPKKGNLHISHMLAK